MLQYCVHIQKGIEKSPLLVLSKKPHVVRHLFLFPLCLAASKRVFFDVDLYYSLPREGQSSTVVVVGGGGESRRRGKARFFGVSEVGKRWKEEEEAS